MTDLLCWYARSVHAAHDHPTCQVGSCVPALRQQALGRVETLLISCIGADDE